MKTMTCSVCGKETERRAPGQKYCPECSSEKDAQRKRKWTKETKYKPPIRTTSPERKEIRTKLSREASADNRAGPTWIVDNDPDLVNLFRFAIPYNKVLSKNSIWSLGNKRGHVYIRKEVRAEKDALILVLRNAKIKWYEGKVWLDIFVEKPSHHSDAINMIDFICDAVKEAIGVDDRWFSIRRLDWAIVKDNPRIWIGVSQEIEENHGVCAICGKILPREGNFYRSKHTPSGWGRECKSCLKTIGKRNRKTERKGE